MTKSNNVKAGTNDKSKSINRRAAFQGKGSSLGSHVNNLDNHLLGNNKNKDNNFLADMF